MKKDSALYYDGIASGYNELHGAEQEKKYKIILKHLKIKPNDKVLDVGCGTGLFFRHLPKNSFGIDPSEGLLKKVPKEYKKQVKQAGAESIPFPDNSFDAVVSATALQNASDLKKAVSEMKRVGKENAKFAITFLKKSNNAKQIKNILEKTFPKAKWFEEEKDFILITPIE
jgi:ubiquinone/menaquinone biosynthesis C-methylase UbiE